MPWKVFQEGARFCVHKLNDDDSKGEKVKCFDSEDAANDQLKTLYANVKEFRGAFTEVMSVTSLQGKFPTVPIFSDVDYEGLIAEDTRTGTQPMFVTLPIGKAGVTSRNKRHYDDEFVTELLRQTLANKPVGLFGHLSDAERATAFPAEAVHWVGAIRDGDTLWGKGYIPSGPVRDRLARYKASGKQIATSIDAFAEGTWDETLKAHRMSAKSLRLNQIDIAPADRAGIPDLATVPMLTTEMESGQEKDIEQEPEMDKLQVINEMTADDARLLPEPVRAAIVATVPTPPEVAQVQELRQALGVDDKADLAKLVTEMRETQEKQRRAEIANRITELATEGIKVEAVRGVVVEMVNARMPQTPEEAATAYQEIAASASITELLKSTVQSVMGPRQTTRVQPQQGGHKYFNIPQEA